MEDKSAIFKKISSIDERDKILSDMAFSRVEVICKGLDDNLYKVHSERFEQRKLVCKISRGQTIPFFKDHPAIVTFTLSGDKYFFQANCKTVAGELVFDFPFDIFQLQRRQSYRLKIPSSYRAQVAVVNLNNRSTNILSTMQDLSTGGCRFVVKLEDAHFKIDDHLEIFMHFKDRDSLHCKGEVRYVNGTVVGIEFKNTTPAFESTVFSITLDLHKEFFAHL